HLQITYYLAIMIGFLGIAYFVDAIMKKTLPDFFKASGVLIIAALLGVAPSTSLLWTTSQYAAETMRGQSELPAKDGEVSSGLNLDYALRWSYGVEESFTLLVPNFYGGSTSFLVKDRELERQFGQKNLRLRTYWGDQPSTSGPVYVGAIICFLFVLGLLITRGPIKWAMLATFLIFLMLSWGKNFLPLTELFFNIFPGYNKFRAVSMTLVMVEFAMPLLGILALNKVIQTEKKDRKNLTRPLLIAGGITGGLSLIFALLGGVLFDFSGAVDSQMNASVVDILVNLRSDMLLSDSLRSFALIAVAFGLIWFYLRDAIKPSLLYAGLTALVVIDMLPVNARFLNEDNYVNERTLKNEYTPSQADQFIMQDPDPDFRVVNLPGSPNQIIQVVNEARTSYYHRNIGGYHAAKLGRYNDLIDTVLIQDIYQLYQVLGEQNDSIRQLRMSNLDVLNMLNLRYVIYPTQQAGPQAFQYTGAHGSAWFVNRIQQVQTPQEEILALRSINTGNTAVVDVAIDGGRFGEQIKGLGNQSDPNARITLTSFDNKRITYKSNSSQPQLAVFSEIYYNDKKGWKAYLDGQEVPHLRANYVLRALNVPAGEHEIEFRFEPAAYFTGETISLISSIILLLLMAGVAFLEWRRRNQENSLEESNNQAT
ncbi:MAG: YfhO family protein, partial [Bacteroidota bacterium]